jgi:hypothetical protein
VSALRFADAALALLALPVVLLAGGPLLGWVAGVAIWALWRLIGGATDARARRVATPRGVAGITVASTIGRAWLLIVMLLAVGLSTDDATGLTAALVVLLLFTVHLTTKTAFAPARRRRPSTPPTS